MWNEVERIRPQIFGYILDIIAKVMSRYNEPAIRPGWVNNVVSYANRSC